MKFPLLLSLGCATIIAPASAQAPAAHETGVLLNAADVLPAELLRGTSHRVRQQVATDGFMAYFEIDSDFGFFPAIGVPQARARVVEVEAIRALVETCKSDLFAEGLRRSIEQPIDAARNIVRNPVDTVTQAPRTVGNFFGQVGSTISRGASRVADRASGEAPSRSAGETVRGIGNAARNAAGFERARLDTARQLGVDPYSDNTRLQEELDKVTWAFFAGGMPLQIGARAISGGTSRAISATNTFGLPADTFALTQSELARRDERSLAAMGITTETVRTFQNHPHLSISRRHRIVVSLEALPNAQGRGNMVQLANSCTTPEEADFLVAALAILAEQQRSAAANFTSLRVLDRLPGAVTAGGELHVPAPVDHVTWTEEVAGFALRDDLGTQPKALIHTGRFSQAANRGFLAAGWRLTAVPYPSR